MNVNGAVEALELTIEWLDNLERKFGRVPVFNQMPNNYSGRFSILDVIELLKEGEIIRRMKVTLADHAEAWQRERGETVPQRSSLEWELMYERWIDYAFENLSEK